MDWGLGWCEVRVTVSESITHNDELRVSWHDDDADSTTTSVVHGKRGVVNAHVEGCGGAEGEAVVEATVGPAIPRGGRFAGGEGAGAAACAHGRAAELLRGRGAPERAGSMRSCKFIRIRPFVGIPSAFKFMRTSIRDHSKFIQVHS